MNRRVVITGIGLLTPLGHGLEETWTALLEGRSGAAPITLFDTTGFATSFACEVKEFDPTRWIDKRLAKTLDRFVQFALSTAQMASDDAELVFDDKEVRNYGIISRKNGTV